MTVEKHERIARTGCAVTLLGIVALVLGIALHEPPRPKVIYARQMPTGLWEAEMELEGQTYRGPSIGGSWWRVDSETGQVEEVPLSIVPGTWRTLHREMAHVRARNQFISEWRK